MSYSIGKYKISDWKNLSRFYIAGCSISKDNIILARIMISSSTDVYFVICYSYCTTMNLMDTFLDINRDFDTIDDAKRYAECGVKRFFNLKAFI